MKKLILILFAGTLTGILISGPSCWALSELEVSGELDALGEIYLAPSSKSGQSAFSVPSFFLNFIAPLKDGNSLVATLEGTNRRDPTDHRFQVETRYVYLDLVSPFQDSLHALRLGLIPQPWHEAQYADWEYRFLGPTEWVMTEKFKYLSASDLGASFRSELPHDAGDWALTVLNGEGTAADELSPHKEASVLLRWTLWDPVIVTLNYIRGSYNQYASDIALKERIQAQVTYHHEDQWLAGVEFLDAHDPADVINDLGMADEVDVTALLGQSVHGQGASVFTQISTGPKAQIMFRYDYLNPVLGQKMDINTWMAALSYQLTGDIRLALAGDYSKYGSQFGYDRQEQSKVEIATQVVF